MTERFIRVQPSRPSMLNNFTQNISYEKAFKALSTGGPLTIRQVTSTDRKHEVRELMKARYAHKNYPDEFSYRCKCIVVFQNIDGVDVVLFALYVYEHGEDNPLPNKRTVYVSYLDSVHFMMPRKMRTFIYHEILISYLDYARHKGIYQAFIWACPPLKGDDYIFYAKPEDQKTPKDVRLRQWYLEMLVECQKRSIVGKITNMYDEYFNDKTLDASAVPYFEGDYFPGEAENIIKELNDSSKKTSSGVGKKAASKSKRSGDVDTDAEYKDGGRDPVMQKFCDAISGMKESFMVAFLECKDAKPENRVVPENIIAEREAYNKLMNENTKDEKSILGKRGEADEKQFDRFGRTIRVLDDDVEEIDCEFFNTRQAFLDLCRGNHYQFDELRRAKHTSMMVLWHLQNREAPKFVQQCFACAREISSGVRHHCNVCPDFDLCHECFQDPKVNRGSCTHVLEVVKVDAVPAASALTEEQRKERQRNIKLHIALIEHASQCKSTTCNSSNCMKMKTYLKHGQTCKVSHNSIRVRCCRGNLSHALLCLKFIFYHHITITQIKAGGGCKVCKRIWTLLRIHAQQCKNLNCPIPQCIAIRKRIRQLQLKQRAMDDRRRQEMNRHYRMGQTSEAPK
jgi:E1A/CREB-binding protein